MYNYNHLFYFYICAQFKSVSKAANYLNTSQPSLSIQLKTLEENLKLKLFSRNGRSLELTNGGQIIFSFCEKMFSESKNIDNYINTRSTVQRDSISIGVSAQIERPYTADVVGSLLGQYKRKDTPKIKMQTLSSNEMLSQLKIGQMDLVITHEKVQMKNTETFQIDFPVALVGIKKHLSFSSEKKPSLKNFFKNYKGGIVVPIEDFKLRTETDLFFTNHSFSPDIIFESGNLSANIRAISEGVGIGFLPIIYTLKEIKNGKLAYIMPSEGLWKHSFYIYCSKNSFEKQSIIQLVKLFQTSATNM